MGTPHDKTAERIAKKKGVDYNKGQGPDVITPGQVIEVETKNTVGDASRQLQGFQKPVYIAGADKEATEAALEAAEGTTIGVMDPQGKIIKSSSRKRN